MKRAFIIHGWGGFPGEGWQSWLKKKLEGQGFNVHALAMPDPDYPRLNTWLKTLSDAVKTPNESCYFIGHSLGCITILRYLETLKESQKVGGTVFVGGFIDMAITVDENEDIQEIKTFFETELDFERVKQHCRKFVAIHSDNDPYVDLRYADIFREKLGAKIIVEHGKRHFSEEDGVQELPSALKSVL